MIHKNQERENSIERWISTCKAKAINGLVVTFPGSGFSHIVRKLATSKEVVFLTGRSGELGEISIVYLDWINNLESFEVLDRYFLSIKGNQKIIAVIDDPSLLDSEIYRNSYASKQIYDQYWFGLMGKDEVFNLIDSFVVNMPKKEKQEIWEISGGVPQIVKHLALRTKIRDLEVLKSDFAIQVICQPMVKVINRSSRVHLEKLGIYINNNINSLLLKKLIGVDSFLFDIKIKPDLLILEDGESFRERLSRLERDILCNMLNTNGFITKDKVAEIKWGSEEYSKFSDQAINKTMRRLNGRLHRYKIVTKWKTGYMLASR